MCVSQNILQVNFAPSFENIQISLFPLIAANNIGKILKLFSNISPVQVFDDAFICNRRSYRNYLSPNTLQYFHSIIIEKISKVIDKLFILRLIRSRTLL